MKPDLVIGFSDLQADIARDLTKAGLNVLIFNQRSVQEILDMILALASLVGAADQGARALVQQLETRWTASGGARKRVSRRPRVYFEEWDEPMISGIRWVSELVEIAGGEDVFSRAPIPRGRRGASSPILMVVKKDPEVILGSWCGKKFRPERVASRPGWDAIAAVREHQLFEIKSADILQPGPAALTDGVRQIHEILRRF